MTPQVQTESTQRLSALSAADPHAASRLPPLVYEDFRRLARRGKRWNPTPC
jgi:hypothetical protein